MLDGTFFNSGNPAAGTNAAYTNLSGAMIPVVFSYGTESGDTNFGQRPFTPHPLASKHYAHRIYLSQLL
jgi:hypothetical protein